ncbi:MAG: Asp-tRNA(Asn)/Glu-tRNA(Gln) amidotransferase subunit GatC [Deltaproteobacteria bacterium]|nr:Asp-tRNA(Asn)/Glu-tRNA(Gln) amidotransferase subunit GatC [Deltaproteobacteria bacterium]
MRLSDRELTDLESLAALRLQPEERRALQDHLARILEYVDRLRSIDTEGIDPTFHPAEVPTPLRDDLPAPSLPAAKALEQAPARSGDHFEVPPVLFIDEGAS